MAGKGGKGLVAAKTTAANKDKEKEKDKKRPVSRSSRAGIQVLIQIFSSLLPIFGIHVDQTWFYHAVLLVSCSWFA